MISTLVLLERIQLGDSDAMEAFFLRYLPRIQQMIEVHHGFRLPQNRDDMIQETAIRVFRKIRQFEIMTLPAFRGWLFQLVDTAVKDHLRRERAWLGPKAWMRHASCLDHDVLVAATSGDDDPLEQAAGRELCRELYDAILELPEEFREMIILRYFQGMSSTEIGKRLNLRPPTVRTILARIRAELYRRLPRC